jgi:regulator of protease activity HflC (stomatin/prohibitin superfamily)
MAGLILQRDRQGKITMAFPYPETPDDWQTAYTRNDAHRDSRKFGSSLLLPIILSFLVVLTYTSLYIRSIPFLDGYSPLIRGTLLFVGILLFFLLFAILLIIPSLRFATKFFTEFYLPPENIDPSKIITYRLLGKAKLPPPLNMFVQFQYIIAKNGDIDKKDKWPAWAVRNLGGPINLIVFDGTALYLERGNRFSRVVGPGEKIPFLEWYETIKYVVDLRPKVQEGSFDVWTKDGIKIKLEVAIECRIGDPSKNDPANGVVYPYDPVAVKKAVERASLRWPKRQEGEPSEFTWIDAAWGQVTGIVPGYIGSRTLDDLLIADRKSGQILSLEALEDVKAKLNKATRGFGVFITDFQILKVEMPELVYAHQKAQWKTERESIDTIIDGQAKASHIRLQEKARADAQSDLIMTITEGLQKNPSESYADALILSLSNILDNELNDPYVRATIANETLDTLEKIKTMLDKP